MRWTCACSGGLEVEKKLEEGDPRRFRAKGKEAPFEKRR